MENLYTTASYSPGQYLLFRIARQDFAMDAVRIRAILPAAELIPLETPHEWICGTSHIRGRDLPVVDLRSKMNIPPGTRGRAPCIVVVQTAADCGTALAGFMVDRVSDLVTLRERDLRNGFAHTPGRLRRLLNPDLVFSEEDRLSFSQRELINP